MSAPPGPNHTPVPRAAPAPDAEPPAGKVKGTLLIGRMTYLRARGDDDAERVLRRMTAADQQVLRGMLLPSSGTPPTSSFGSR